MTITTLTAAPRTEVVGIAQVEQAERAQGHDLTPDDDGDWICLVPSCLVTVADGTAEANGCTEPFSRQRRHKARVGRITIESPYR